ncbi:hypothetical protein [Aneurinibacillus aneurinilyticus]|uniref:hypothetical protein n=1 Tax=Aneurinibacillus aneurinilyticus TaxID=1391 RepID=UPI0035262BAB
MQKEITVRAKMGFELFNHDHTKLLAEVHEGDIHTANLYEESEEYFSKDREGREFKVGELDMAGNLKLEEDFELFNCNGIKFSELREGQYVEHDGEIITKDKALEIFKLGTDKPMYTVTQDFISSILKQVYKDGVNGVDKEVYTALNHGQLIIFEEIK